MINRRDVRELAKAIGILLIVFVVFALIMHIGFWHFCTSYERNTGRATKLAAFDHCYVKADSGWQRWNEYIARAAASEAVKEVMR